MPKKCCLINVINDLICILEEEFQMRKRGRRYIPLTNEERKLVEDFLSNDLSYEEMSNKIGISKSQLRYKVMKYQKEVLDDKQKTIKQE